MLEFSCTINSKVSWCKQKEKIKEREIGRVSNVVLSWNNLMISNEFAKSWYLTRDKERERERERESPKSQSREEKN